jgi:molybdopterin converting factor subunit 1
MTVTVHLFARARDLADAGAVSLELPAGATVADLRRELGRRLPALAGLLERSAVAVNHDFAENHRVLAAADEVAIIPPVSGG